MHDVSLQAVIYAFLRYYYGLISECEAFTALIYAIPIWWRSIYAIPIWL